MTRLARMKRSSLLALLIGLVSFGGCNIGKKKHPLFKLLSPNETGISFANTITTDDSLNAQTDVYVYNGAGVGIGDIDNDGLPDIFFAGNMVSSRLYLNKGAMRFESITEQAGVTTKRWATGVTMVDINNDGYLDIYVSVSGPAWSKPEERANLLFVNNRNRTFTEAAAQYGIADTAFTTHAVFLDYNKDGCLDLFLLNNSPKDFTRGVTGHPSGMRGTTPGSFNELYRNDCIGGKPGKFTNVSRQAGILRDAGFGLGVVAADLDEDGWPDIYVSNDVAPNDVVYVNNRDGTFTNKAARWLKHTSFAGMGVDIADFNNDGRPDILQVDMMPRDLSRRKQMSGFTTYGSLLESRSLGFRDDFTANSLQLSNGVTKDGDVIFSDIASLAGVAHTDWSWSALFADFDNDGYKDIFISNGYPKAVNDLDYQTTMFAHHYLGIKMEGDSPNRRGIGSRLILTAGGHKQYLYHSPYRGYMSTMDDRAHFGLGRVKRVDSLEVIWPDGRHQLLTGLRADTLLILKQADATQKKQPPPPNPSRVFEAMDAKKGLAYKAQPSSLVDYNVQPLLPYIISRHGPPLATGDVNGDGLDDVFIGGASGGAGQLFVQKKDGSFVAFTQGQPWEADKAYDDWGALFFDANGDGLQDLYVASGGYQLAPSSALLQDRLYINKGDGRFARNDRALPEMLTSTATVRAGDFNGDGRPDLFVGGRLSPRNYPSPTRSYLLRNDGGHFTDVTKEVAPELLTPGGMITDAVWIDFDGDGHQDLVTVGQWMPIQFYKNDGIRLHEVTKSTGLPPSRGWWYSLATGDFDKDGRPDLVAGNLGLNYTYTTSNESRFGIYASDFTGNRTTDIVLTQEIAGKEYPFAGLATLGDAIYTLGVRFPTYASFAQAPVSDVFNPSQLKKALHYQTDTFASVYLHNAGGGKFSSSPLPNLAQISPIKGIIVHDVDGDGNLDLIVAGNLYDVEPNTPRADAGNGLWLRGNGRGRFTPVPPSESGLLAPLNVAGLALISTPAGKAVLVANTGDSLQAFNIRKR